MSKKDFIKITVQDIEIAEDFFDNDKHLNEFLINVIRYYRGKPVVIKTKIVQRYFKTYQKTMDFILVAKKAGKYGATIKAENQALKDSTLEGSLEASLEAKKKEERRKKEEQTKRDLIFSFEEFWKLYPTKKGKAPCEILYKKITSENRKIIKYTLNDFIKHKPFADYNHPNPSTYLNQERWNDEITIKDKVHSSGVVLGLDVLGSAMGKQDYNKKIMQSLCNKYGYSIEEIGEMHKDALRKKGHTEEGIKELYKMYNY